MTAQLFVPKPWEAGARITWRHFYPTGAVVEREGTVWDRAPKVDGAVVVSWVIPDEPLDSDLYHAIAVGKANSRSQCAHGRYLDTPFVGEQYASRGEAFSSNYAGSPLGKLTAQAANHAMHATKLRRQRGLR